MNWRFIVRSAAWLFLLLLLVLASPALAGPPATKRQGDCGVESAWALPDECRRVRVLPSLVITPVRPHGSILQYAYGQVITASAPVYGHPADDAAGRSPKRRQGTGFIFVSVTGQTTYRGQIFYQINPNEFMRAIDLQLVAPSTFHGAYFTAPPTFPFGWVVAGDRLRSVPGAPPNANMPTIGRYQPVTIYGIERVGDWDWYLVGPDEWIEQRNVGGISPQPAASGLNGRWIEVNLYEQTVAAFENGQLAYATLASTGSRAWPTRLGLFQVWARQEHGRQTGAYRTDKSDYYFLEDVPWVMYFDGDISLHAAYWHDSFGFRKSHGCVNLASADAQWLFGWTGDGTPVYVYSSALGNAP